MADAQDLKAPDECSQPAENQGLTPTNPNPAQLVHKTDPDLEFLAERWDSLPENIRRAILALADVAGR
ncbi:MAG TPA: hypothetical protein VMG59_12115 [Phycisphaerae bacterium]|nr:hypothetical protein [Phycisphaerae bacterium]